MDAQDIDAKRAALKDLIARFILLEKALEILPASDDRYNRALAGVAQAVKEADRMITELQEALGSIYDAAMDWPTEEELQAYGKR